MTSTQSQTTETETPKIARARRPGRAAERIEPGIPDAERLQIWRKARDTWLVFHARTCQSTCRLYGLAWEQFFGYCHDYFGIPPWRVETAHARAWQEHLQEEGLAAATINQKLSGVSSFFNFIIHGDTRITGLDKPIYVDSRGRPRVNPLGEESNLLRIKRVRHVKTKLLSREDAEKTMRSIHTDSLTGARNYALLLTFFYTGCRTNEVLEMRWGDIEGPSGEGGNYSFQHRGMGGRMYTSVLPTRCYEAIVHYLELARRWPASRPRAIQPDEYIWQPLQTHGIANFGHVHDPDANRHIVGSQVNDILHRCLRRAGVEDPESYHVFSLRHAFAHSYVEATGDVAGLSKQLHHTSQAVTRTYLRGLAKAGDDYAAALQNVLGF